MSYFPGGNPDPFGCSPCGGGGGGGGFIVVWCYTSSEGCVPAQTDVMYKTKAAISAPVFFNNVKGIAEDREEVIRS